MRRWRLVRARQDHDDGHRDRQTRLDTGRALPRRHGLPHDARRARHRHDGHRPQAHKPTAFESHAVEDNLVLSLKGTRLILRRCSTSAAAASTRSSVSRGSETAGASWPPNQSRPEAVAGGRQAARQDPKLLVVGEPVAGMADAAKITCVLGRDGVGRSSLMRSIVGPLPADVGKSCLRGEGARPERGV